RLSAGPVLGQLLRAPRQCGARAAPAIGNARQNLRPRPTLAQPIALYGRGRRRRAGNGTEPMAHRDRRLIELVPLVSHREELSALARCRWRTAGLWGICN